MKNVTIAKPITITLGGETHTLPSAEGVLPMLTELARVDGSSFKAYMASAARLGSALWQLRKGAPYGTWKNLIARAGIDEKWAQRVMRVAARLAPAGEIDAGLVEKMREVARANKCTLPFVQSDEALSSWNQAARLVQEAEKVLTPRQTPHARGQTSAFCGVRSDHKNGEGMVSDGESGEAGDSLRGDLLRGEAAVARAMNMTVDDYRQYLADLEAEEAALDEAGSEGSLDMASVSDAPRVTTVIVGAPGPQLGLADVYEHAARVRSEFERRVEAVKAGRCGAGDLERVMRAFEAGLAALPV